MVFPETPRESLSTRHRMVVLLVFHWPRISEQEFSKLPETLAESSQRLPRKPVFTVTGVAECWRGRSKSPRGRWPRRSGRAWIGEERGDAVLRHAFGSGLFRHGLLHLEVCT